MRYAIVEISGRQFWIETGKYYDLNRIPTELGKEIILNRVLLVNNDGELLIGKPYLDSVTIKGKILERGLEKFLSSLPRRICTYKSNSIMDGSN